MYDSTPDGTDAKRRHLAFRPAVIFVSPLSAVPPLISSPSNHIHSALVTWPSLHCSLAANSDHQNVFECSSWRRQHACKAGFSDLMQEEQNKMMSVFEIRSSGHAGCQLGKAAWVFTGLSTFFSFWIKWEWKLWSLPLFRNLFLTRLLVNVSQFS